MKKMFVAICLSFMLVFAGNAFAFMDYNDNSTNATGGAGGAGGNANAVGVVGGASVFGDVNTLSPVGMGGDGGDATVTNSGNSAVAVGNTVFGDTFSPSAEQDQEQSQRQSQSNTNFNSDFNSNVNSIKGNTNDIDIDIITPAKREIMAQPMVTFSSLGEYKEGADMGANFQTVEMLTMFKKVFSYEAAFENYGKQYGKGKCETIGHSYNGRHENEPSKEIKVFTLDDEVDASTVTSIGFLTIKSIDKKINSFMVLQKAVLSAALMQGDAIVVTNQGAATVTKSSGWGLGFNTSGGSIAEDGDRGKSAVASGGTGYSNGTAKLLTMPWMTVQVLKFK